MANLEVIAHMKVRPGQLDGFKAQAAEILRATRQADTHTLRCDWFINEDGSQCEVHESFPNEQGLIEHKMNTMEATVVMFNEFAFDHQVAIFGDVSQDLISLVTARMGPPTVFSFLQGLQGVWDAPVKGSFGVIARLKARPGQLEGFKSQVAEMLRLTRQQDTHTLCYDWFVSADGTEYEVHEAYVSEDGLVEHNTHIREARDLLFQEYAFDHRMSVYGEISEHLRELFAKHAGGVNVYSLSDGLEAAASV
jgi:quinol monooxygenase YgiN